jgi:predicted alpha/beta-hydrolase family hydrolase
MNQPFLNFFQKGIAEAGFPCLKFNFFYSEAKRKIPDPQPLLMSCYQAAIDAAPSSKVVIGGKSMGGRIASYVGNDERVVGLLFLGYPLHAPAKPDQLRDEHLYTIHKPMLFASGTKDPFARHDSLEKVIKKIGRYASTFYVEGGGHSFEVPKKSGLNSTQINNNVLNAITAWLRNL